MRTKRIKRIRELCEKFLNTGEITELANDLIDIVIINKNKEKV